MENFTGEIQPYKPHIGWIIFRVFFPFVLWGGVVVWVAPHLDEPWGFKVMAGAFILLILLTTLSVAGFNKPRIRYLNQFFIPRGFTQKGSGRVRLRYKGMAQGCPLEVEFFSHNQSQYDISLFGATRSPHHHRRRVGGRVQITSLFVSDKIFSIKNKISEADLSKVPEFLRNFIQKNLEKLNQKNKIEKIEGIGEMYQNFDVSGNDTFWIKKILNNEEIKSLIEKIFASKEKIGAQMVGIKDGKFYYFAGVEETDLMPGMVEEWFTVLPKLIEKLKRS